MLNGETRIAPSTPTASMAAPIWSPADLCRSCECAYPRTTRMVAFVGVHLSVDRQHACHLLQLAKPALLIGRLCWVVLAFKSDRLALVRAESGRSASRLRAVW